MAEQLRLDIPWPPAESREVLFFGIMPGSIDGARLTALGEQLTQARLHPAARFHLSLLGLGLDMGSRDAQIADLQEVGGAVAAAPFEIVLEKVCSFGDGLVLCCGEGTGASMLQLQRILLCAAAERGIHLRAKQRYAPHLTLSYRAPPVPLARLKDPIRWLAQEFVLVLSEQGRGRYTRLGRWPLG